VKTKEMPKSPASAYYHSLSLQEAPKFRGQVIALMGWTARQFRYRFKEGNPLPKPEARMIADYLNLDIATIYAETPNDTKLNPTAPK
jgi:hypothetical protein